jgi:prephenate dehydrogenase
MNIGIIGLGLIGASIAKAMKGKAHLTGIDTDIRTVKRALSDGVISRGGTDLAFASGCDMVVISVPVARIVETASNVIPYLRGEAVVTDSGSTKAHIVQSIDMFCPSFVGSHPIAGKENPGYASSQADLFRRAMTIITPSASTKRECIEKVCQLWESCGSRTSSMDPQKHDELMAVISHMPHLLSYVSMSMAEKITMHRDLLGAGFKDFTRIAASDPVMWRDIFLENAQNILPLVDRYMDELQKVRSLIEKGKGDELEESLSAYALIRRGLYGDSR